MTTPANASAERQGLSLTDVARYPRPGTAIPGRVAFTPDGASVMYLHSGDGSLVRSRWEGEGASGERRVVAGSASEVTGEAKPRSR